MSRPGDAAPLEETQDQKIARIAKLSWVVECVTKYGAMVKFLVAGMEQTDLLNELQQYKKDGVIWSGSSYFIDLSDVCFINVREPRQHK